MIAALAALAASLLVTPGANAAVGQVRASADYQLKPTANPLASRAKAGPGFAVNPANASHIVETHQELETEECEYNVSTDGGANWTGGTLEAPAGYPGQGTRLPGPCDVTGHGAGNIGQQSVAFGSGTNVYIAWTSTTDPAGNRTRPPTHGFTVLLSRSVDGGVTFSPGVPVRGMEGSGTQSFFRPEIVVEPRAAGDRIYIASRESRASRAWVVRSDDGGTNWTDRVEASETGAAQPIFDASGNVTTAGNAYRRAVEVTAPALGPDPGNGGFRPIYVAWRALRDAPPPVAEGETPPPCPPTTAGPSYCEGPGEIQANGYLVVAKSTDGGVNWTRTRAVNVQGWRTVTGVPAGGFTGSAYPRIAVGPEGNAYLVFTQGPGVGTSNNCGVGPFPAGAPGAGATNTCPRFTGEGYAASAGTFRKADHFIHWDSDAWFIRSTDGGATWGNLRQLNDPKQAGLVTPEITQTRHPQVFVAPDGRVDTVWEDRRHWYISPAARRAAVTPGGTAQTTSQRDLANYPCVHTHAACDEGRLGDTYYAWSTDGGVNFGPNRRINDRSHNNDVGSDYRFSVYWDYGPAAVPIGTDQLLVADMDARLGNVETDSLDIFLRRVNVNPGDAAIPVESAGTGTAPALSVALSQRAYPGGSEAVLAGTFASRPRTQIVIVNQADMPAALAAGVLARANLGPVLASPAAGLPDDVKAEVKRLADSGAIGALVIGGTNALSAQVENDLVAQGVPAAEITRIDGTKPAPDPAAVRTDLPAFDAAVIANPHSASAASASALAANRRLPVLYVDQNSIPAATSEALQFLGITKTLVIGSTTVISSGVESQLPNPTRLSGGDQFATSDAVLGESVARGLPKNMVYVADGNEPMHGALLGAAVGRIGGLLTLQPGGSAAAAQSDVDNKGLSPHVDRIVTSDLTGTATVDGDLIPTATAASAPTATSAAIAAEIAEAMDTRLAPPPPPATEVGPDPGSDPGASPAPAPDPGTGTTPLPTGADGYRMIAADGGVFVFGERNFEGSLGDRRLNKPIVGGASNPATFRGYWMVASDGGVFNFGDAGFFGSLGGEDLTSPIVEIEPTPSGQGYFLVDARGRVYPFGDAVQGIPDARDLTLNKSIIGMTVTPTGRGYYLVASDGGIFTYGDAVFQGSTGDLKLNAPVIDLAVTPDGQGYYLLGGDGGVFSFGTAEFRGSTGDIKLNKPAVAMLVAPNGSGYWFMASDGGVFTFGSIPFLGSMGGTPLTSPVLDAVH
ncbi:MAG: hypothetical protein KY458_09460 [Actinobacteria bacterium]|nr:hypothetical protein [Actinomycetota bacterium]